MVMTATVTEVNPQSLLVRNEETGEVVLVIFRDANRFSVGDRVRITYNGQMTFSIPPQITATAIQRLSPALRPTPREVRAVVLQRGRNSLLVQSLRDRQQLRVEYPFAHHFCVGQRVDVRYNTITMSNPPRVTATDILPVC